MRKTEDGIVTKRNENNAIIWLHAMARQLETKLPDIKELAEEVGDYNQLINADFVIHDQLSKIENALEEHQRRNILLQLRNDAMYIKTRPAGKYEGSYTVMGEDLDTIILKAQQNECAFCLLSGKEVKQCRLRSALLGILQPKEDGNGISCEYAAAVGE